MEIQQNLQPTPRKHPRQALRKSGAVLVNGKLYGPTTYQISVWEYEGGVPLDQEDPLASRKGFIRKTYNYFAKNLQSFF